MSQSGREPSIPLPGAPAGTGAAPSGSAATGTAATGPAATATQRVGPDDQKAREREREREPRRAPRERDGSGALGVALSALLVGLLVGAGGVALLMRESGSGDPFAGQIDRVGYQAVILSNDKVYFGRISAVSDEFYELDEAFFLRETRESPDAEPVRALLPINREIHAPENRILLRRAEVVLVENLEADSPILKEIKRQVGDGK